ncbi:MAG: recombinase family protein [Nitrospirota bacterium]
MQSKKKKKVVAYCRVSTLEQKKRGHGIDIQIRDVTLFTERHGLLVEKFYKDEGESGVKEDRKALRQLMRDCKNKRIETIILPSLDRLSREVRIAENLFHELKYLGVKVLISDMPYYNGERKDILIRQILEAIAEENRRDIIERLRKGREERTRKGLFPGGNLPYGYLRKNKKILVYPHEADIVNQIYVLASDGYTGQAIANHLNQYGYKRRNGNSWTQRQVCRILHNERLYRGGFVHYGDVIGEGNVAVLLADSNIS